MISVILSLLKNKWFIYGAIALCCVLFIGGIWLRGNYYQNKLEATKAEYEKQRFEMYDQFAREAAAHNARLIEIETISKDTQQRIKNLRLQNEKCQNADYYRPANNILNRSH